ncbi:hypothetical protein AAFF_G00093930 [Aldrovandia affinis]|uniref:Uncharacterized protein n=1 Tax=Aldrovandia affinis TaxID=143900 RepID=A0AAD7WY14_9TELE|nr:hypothetical protein AAFF_G00093930 [Aldrovandia affinis]
MRRGRPAVSPLEGEDKCLECSLPAEWQIKHSKAPSYWWQKWGPADGQQWQMALAAPLSWCEVPLWPCPMGTVTSATQAPLLPRNTVVPAPVNASCEAR